MIYPVSFMAQDKHDFSVELNVNRANYKMGSLNNYLNDTNAFSNDFYGARSRNIKSGMDYNLFLNYQPLNFMDVGVYINYQSAFIEMPIRFIFEEEPPFEDYVVEGKHEVNINAIGTGVSANLFLNKLLNLDQRASSALNKIQIAVGVLGGVGFSNLISQKNTYIVDNPNSNPNNVITYSYNSKNFTGRTEVKLGYRLGKVHFFDVGIKCGYQFFKTSELKNYAGYTFNSSQTNGKAVNLDFGGLYYGIYLKIGK